MENKKNNDVYITHIFDADHETVFDAWTDPKQLPKWFAPEGCNITFRTLDIRQNGSFHYCIHTPQHGDCWCKGKYLEIVRPEKLVFTMEVADASGNNVSPTEAGMDTDWPVSTTVTILFNELGQKTEVVLMQTVSESLAKKTGAHPSWIMMMERLEGILRYKS